MASGPFSKQAIFLGAQKLNSNFSDTVIGGAISTAPSGLNASQFEQTLPGDRIILSPSDALAWSNNNQNLFTGSYRYVASRNNSASAPTVGHGAFWDCNNANGAASVAQDALYQVTSDEAANHTVSMFAGVFINNMTKGNYWWIQESGKTTCKFATTITAPTPALGAGVYLYAGGNNNNAADVGAFDQLVGANSAAIFQANSTTGYTTVDNMLLRYVGPAEGLPSNNNLSIVDITLSRSSFRF